MIAERRQGAPPSLHPARSFRSRPLSEAIHASSYGVWRVGVAPNYGFGYKHWMAKFCWRWLPNRVGASYFAGCWSGLRWRGLRSATTPDRTRCSSIRIPRHFGSRDRSTSSYNGTRALRPNTAARTASRARLTAGGFHAAHALRAANAKLRNDLGQYRQPFGRTSASPSD